MVRVIYILFVLSGFIGLMYESLWARYLKLFLGHSSYGQILTLIIYMGGLGIGSFLGAALAKKSRNPFYLYAIVEFLIGIGGFFYHDIYCLATNNFYSFVQQTTLSMIVCQGLKIGIAIGITSPVAILLGMTFPALAVGLMRHTLDGGTKTLPNLYFANSFGAAIGIIVTSYALIPLLGTIGALTLAAMGNMAVALGFYGIAHKVNTFPKKTLTSALPATIDTKVSQEKINTNIIGFWLLVSGITGFSSFLYEIGWIRLISLLFGSSTHSFDIMISAFIAGLAFGGLYSRKIIRRSPRIVLALAWIQVCMGVLALGSLYAYKPFFLCVNAMNDIFIRSNASYVIYSAIKYFLSVLLVCPASFFAGMTLPIITLILTKRFGDEKFTGSVYGWNTFGSILGAAIGGLIFLPLLQLKMTIATGAMIDIILGFCIFFSVTRSLPYRLALSIGGAAVIAPVFFMQLDQKIVTAGAYRHGVNFKNNKQDLIIADGRTATISFHKINGAMFIKTNGKPDASISTNTSISGHSDIYTQAALAFYPMGLLNRPYTAAVIGMGSGMTPHLLLGDTLSRSVDIIEIEKEVYRLARNFMPYNRHVYESPKAHMVFEDAKTFFHMNRRQYDVIVSEPSNPWVSGVASLFTKEFYQQAAPFLAPEGVLVQWMHLYEFNSDLMLTILKAIEEVFPFFQIYQVPVNSSDIVIIAGKADFSFKRNALSFSSAATEGLPQLTKDPDLFRESNFLASNKTFKAVLAYYHPNSDYFPLVDNGAEKAFFLKTRATLFDAFTLSRDPYLTIFEPELFKSIFILREKYWRKNIATEKNIQAFLCELSSADSTVNWSSLESKFLSLCGSIYRASVWDSFPPVRVYRSYAQKGSMPKDNSLRFQAVDAIIHGDSLKTAEKIHDILTNLKLHQVDPLIVRMMIGEAVRWGNARLLTHIDSSFVKGSPGFDKTEKLLVDGLRTSLSLPRKN